MSFQIGDHGPRFREFQEFLNRKFAAYSNLKLDEYYGLDEAAVVAEAMRRYGLPPTFKTITVNGVEMTVEGAIATDEFLERASWRPPSKPIIFTIEGHLSDMFVGPCAFTAQALEQQGVCKWQPVGYDNVRLPFNNQSGVDEALRLLNSTVMPDGYPFPEDQDWGMVIFSQGGIVGSKLWRDHLLLAAPGTRLAKRRDHLKRVVAFGNPYREKDVVAPWVPDPPEKGTRGISDVRIENTPPFWMEHSRKGDLYAAVPDNEVGANCTAIYKIVSENSWIGGPYAMLSRVIDLLGNPFDGFIDIAWAIIKGIMFAANMGPHGTYDLGPAIEWMRGVQN